MTDSEEDYEICWNCETRKAVTSAFGGTCDTCCNKFLETEEMLNNQDHL